LLVHLFKPRGYIDCVSIGRVVEEPLASEIADNGRPRVYTYSGDTEP
jgi:hypothetical protein